MKRLEVELGALKSVPIYYSHKRAKNWAATISPDPAAPGGLFRKFWRRAYGEYYYMVPPDLKIGDAVEFGADYYSSRGRKDPERWYGIVSEIASGAIVLERTESAKEAIERGRIKPQNDEKLQEARRAFPALTLEQRAALFAELLEDNASKQ